MFYVDLPNPYPPNEEDTFVNVAQTETFNEAADLLKVRYGMPRHIAAWFISGSDVLSCRE